MEKSEKNVKEYLNRKGIEYIEKNGELITQCLFNQCDQNNPPNKSHLYFSIDTGQYHCKKCDSSGNLTTLSKYLYDDIKYRKSPNKPKVDNYVSEKEIEKYYRNIPERIQKYLNSRGIPDHIIDAYKIGYGHFNNRNWITIPVFDQTKKCLFLKLRKDPEDKSNPNKYLYYPTGSGQSNIYGWDSINNNDDLLVICEGEFDSLVLINYGIPAITSTSGASTFKEEWVQHLDKIRKIYVCFDKDEPGKKGSEKVIDILTNKLPETSIYNIKFPERMTEGKDVTDFFTKYNGNPDEFIYELATHVAGPKPIDTSQFKPITPKEIISTLGLTIKKDNNNKLATLLCMLSAYTEEDQFNIGFFAPSSTGKSFIPIETSQLFPSSDVILLGTCSPTSFFN